MVLSYDERSQRSGLGPSILYLINGGGGGGGLLGNPSGSESIYKKSKTRALVLSAGMYVFHRADEVEARAKRLRRHVVRRFQARRPRDDDAANK